MRASLTSSLAPARAASGSARTAPAGQAPPSVTVTPDPTQLVIRHNVPAQRFEALVGGLLAWLGYAREGPRYVLDHTWVPEELRGRGLAAQLAAAALTEARQRHWRILPRCSYVASFLRKHPEFSDLVDAGAGE
ncbi:MAG: N-acetyltransferase [Verrucomicrobiales bacterium]|nr:N-acetyltransferase [Verrucomicrobiales bacterium]